MLWTVVAIVLGGGDRGGGLPLPPYGSHARGTNRAVIPPGYQTRAVFMGNVS